MASPAPSSLNTQPYLIYEKPVAPTQADPSQAASTLSEGRWQNQMGHLFNLFEGQPGDPAVGAAALNASVASPPDAVVASKATPTPSPASVVASKAAPTAAAAAPAHDTPDVKAVAGRHGKVLSADKFLKADQFEGIQNPKLEASGHPPIEGAPNYREVGDNIHGCGQPTVDGMKRVLEKVGEGPPADPSKPPAVWTNLRQEPVIYINGTPYNPRDLKKPMDNEAAPGRTAEEVDKREQQLKQDVLAEAKANGGYMVLHDEVGKYPDNHIVERKVKVDEGSVHTVKETYDELAKEGYNVKYQRIPIEDTKKPEDKDIDAMVQSMKDVDPKSPLIFNCHAGEGRTTTAMVEASLIRRAKNGDTSPALKDKAVREDIKEQGNHDPSNYRSVLQAVKDNEKLQGTQADADSVIAKYSDVHDLKGSVKSERAKSEDAKKTPQQRAEAAQHAKDYLDRYHTIISFDSYVQDQGPDFKKSFEQWKHDNPSVEANFEKAQVAMAAQPQGAGQEQTAFA